jgi:hypothetical protein
MRDQVWDITKEKVKSFLEQNNVRESLDILFLGDLNDVDSVMKVSPAAFIHGSAAHSTWNEAKDVDVLIVIPTDSLYKSNFETKFVDGKSYDIMTIFGAPTDKLFRRHILRILSVTRIMRKLLSSNHEMNAAVQNLKQKAIDLGVKIQTLPLYQGFLIAFVAIDCYNNNIQDEKGQIKKLALLSSVQIENNDFSCVYEGDISGIHIDMIKHFPEHTISFYKEGNNDKWVLHFGTAAVRRGMTIKLLQSIYTEKVLESQIRHVDEHNRSELKQLLHDENEHYPDSCMLPKSQTEIIVYHTGRESIGSTWYVGKARRYGRIWKYRKVQGDSAVYPDPVKRQLTFSGSGGSEETYTQEQVDILAVLLNRIASGSNNLWITSSDTELIDSVSIRSIRHVVHTDEQQGYLLPGVYEFMTEDHECMVDHFNDWFKMKLTYDEQDIKYARRHVDLLKKMNNEKIDESGRGETSVFQWTTKTDNEWTIFRLQIPPAYKQTIYSLRERLLTSSKKQFEKDWSRISLSINKISLKGSEALSQTSAVSPRWLKTTLNTSSSPQPPPLVRRKHSDKKCVLQ